MDTTVTYSEISRSIDERDGALRITVRPANCSHSEHVVTVRLLDDGEFEAAIEDDILDADFSGPEATVEAAIERALEATCEDE